MFTGQQSHHRLQLPRFTETLQTLKKADIKTAGAGENKQLAEHPAVFDLSGKKGRLLFFAYGGLDSGIPFTWRASDGKPGLNLLINYSSNSVRQIKEKISQFKKEGDIVILSIHCGGNWSYEISEEHKIFAHMLIDEAGVDVIYGHSSHHIKGIELYNGKLILYGCGDLINDYEGIGGHVEFRGDLSLLYFVDLCVKTGKLLSLFMSSMRMKRFQLLRASKEETVWVEKMLNYEGRNLGTSFEISQNNTLTIIH
jgi:poly-gamma-glutamate capsule biosynthesis protein CapA/YwtB (metallophosphatase superfamily)